MYLKIIIKIFDIETEAFGLSRLIVLKVKILNWKQNVPLAY